MSVHTHAHARMHTETHTHTLSSTVSTHFFSFQLSFSPSVLLAKFLFTLGKLTATGRMQEETLGERKLPQLAFKLHVTPTQAAPCFVWFLLKRETSFCKTSVFLSNSLTRVSLVLFCFGLSAHMTSLHVSSVCLIPRHRVILHLQSLASTYADRCYQTAFSTKTIFITTM